MSYDTNKKFESSNILKRFILLRESKILKFKRLKTLVTFIFNNSFFVFWQKQELLRNKFYVVNKTFKDI